MEIIRKKVNFLYEVARALVPSRKILTFPHRFRKTRSSLMFKTSTFHSMSKIKAIFFVLIILGNASLSGVFQAYSPRLCLDGFGNAVVVWDAYINGIHRIQSAAYSTDTGSWSAPTTISSQCVDPSAPILAVNETGQAVAVWICVQPEYEIASLFASMRNLEGAWSSPSPISNEVENVANDYMIEISSQGMIIVTWSAFLNEEQQVVRTASASFGGAWSIPETISGP